MRGHLRARSIDEQIKDEREVKVRKRLGRYRLHLQLLDRVGRKGARRRCVWRHTGRTGDLLLLGGARRGGGALSSDLVPERAPHELVEHGEHELRAVLAPVGCPVRSLAAGGGLR